MCRRLHAPRPDAPDAPPPRVVLLTARDGVEARVAGLDAGADDYLVKPFAFPELAARIRAVLRRPALDSREPSSWSATCASTPRGSTRPATASACR